MVLCCRNWHVKLIEELKIWVDFGDRNLHVALGEAHQAGDAVFPEVGSVCMVVEGVSEVC